MAAWMLPDKFVTGVIALQPLPGAPGYDGNDAAILARALADAEIYGAAGVDSVLLENDHDLPYVKDPLPGEAVVLLGEIAREVRASFRGRIGIQILEAVNEQSLEVAAEAELDYIRVEGFVFAHIGSAGLIEGCAGRLLRLRRKLGVPHIKVLADIKKKHCAHALTSDLSIEDEAKQAELFLADGLVVTSKFTGSEPAAEDLQAARTAARLPVIVGSGMTAANIDRYYPLADGFIVGSAFREAGEFLGTTDPGRVEAFMARVSDLKQSAP
jgi:membrane complex biogenesis BtpA family protein